MFLKSALIAAGIIAASTTFATAQKFDGYCKMLASTQNEAGTPEWNDYVNSCVKKFS